MSQFYQIASGRSVSEETTDYIVSNVHAHIKTALTQLFEKQFDFLGELYSFKIGDVQKNNCIPLEVNYLDPTFEEVETLHWELRPIILIQ